MHHVTFNVQCWKLFANNVASVCTRLYSGSSPKGRSCEWTALLTATFSKPVFLHSPTNSVLNSRKRPAPVTDTFFRVPRVSTRELQLKLSETAGGVNVSLVGLC